MLHSAWDLDWKGKETCDKDPQLGQVQKRQCNEYQEEEGAQCVCLYEFRESQGCHPILSRDSCCVGLAWGRAEQTVWTHMQVGHCSQVSTNEMLEM